jgi:hypothetical protein
VAAVVAARAVEKVAVAAKAVHLAAEAAKVVAAPVVADAKSIYESEPFRPLFALHSRKNEH